MKTIIKTYRLIAFWLLGVILIFFLLNIMALFIRRGIQHDEQEETLYELINYDAYTNNQLELSLDSVYINNILEDYVNFLKSREPEFVYHPATEFQSAPISLRNTTVSAYKEDFNRRPTGFDEVTGDSCKAIYCFGGSTTFGSFSNDSHTWPAHLGAMLNNTFHDNCFVVKNYGVPGFVPTQETNQFIYLLKMGHRPSVAIFMDGYNIGPNYDGSDFSRAISKKFHFDGYHLSDLGYVLAELPILKLIRNDVDKIDIAKADDYDIADINTTSENNAYIINRFVENARIRKAVADAYGIPILQFLQPNTYINYNTKLLSPLASSWLSSEESETTKANYAKIYNEITLQDTTFINLSFMFDRYDIPAIVDVIHYSPSFNKHLARTVLEYVPAIDSLTPYRIEKKAATGQNFPN